MKEECCIKKFTEKDLLYLEDMFNWNVNALKLVNHFLNESNDDEVIEMLEEVFDMHYENLKECLNILEGNYKEKDCTCDECTCEDECKGDDNDE